MAAALRVRPCVPLTQLVELDFCELLNSTLTKVVIGYITRELYITSFVENNEFLAIITSFLTKIASFLTTMTFKTRYITEITIKPLFSCFASYTRYSRVVLVTHELYLLLDSIRPYKSCFAGPYLRALPVYGTNKTRLAKTLFVEFGLKIKVKEILISHMERNFRKV